jgi:predicted metal-dependent hydrolase
MTTHERGVIRFGRSLIDYAVERSPHRRTLTIAVDLRTGVLVKAPRETSSETIAAVVRRKGSWILQRLADFAELPAIPRPKEFINGESFLYLGRNYRLKRLPEADCRVSVVKLWGGRLRVTVPNDVGHLDGRDAIRAALIAWYKERARKRLPERVAVFAERLGDVPPAVFVRDQEKRWGSCSQKGELRFNWRIVMAPLSLVDYVVAHEVCHLKLKNHSSAFWQLLRRLMPDYEARRDRLRTMGVQFEI